ncbi:MAG: hypothetical protein SFY32_04235 [Bacteroidota bacterium]|nr:hypothetical protein [Bacteroidota bacterium]
MQKKKIHINQISKNEIFNVPQGYFESFDAISEKLLNTSRLIPNTTKTIFQTPENYFETLPSTIEAKILNISNIEPIEKILPSVPEGYFEELPTLIQIKISKKDDKLQQWTWSVNEDITKFAIAASTILFIASASFLWIKNSNDCTDLLCQVSKEDITNYLNESSNVSEEIIYENVKKNISIEIETKYSKKKADVLYSEIDINDLDSEI